MQSLGKVCTQKEDLAVQLGPGRRCPGFCSKDVGLLGRRREDEDTWSATVSTTYGQAWPVVPFQEENVRATCHDGLQAQDGDHTSERYSLLILQF